MKIIILTMLLCLSIGVEAQWKTIDRWFAAPDTLYEAFGVCSHITNTEYNKRDININMAKEMGASYIRSDMWWWQKLSAFDSIAVSLKTADMKFLPILDHYTKNGTSWLDIDNYAAYVDTLVARYPQYEFWEAINEFELVHKKDGTTNELAQYYTTVLKRISEIVHKYNKKVLFDGIALHPPHDPFVKTTAELGAFEYVDVMNFHCYTGVLCESVLMSELSGLLKVMKDYNAANKPLWITETGSSTQRPTKSKAQFFSEVVPAALERIGVSKEAKIAIVDDDIYEIHGGSEIQVEALREFYPNIEYINLSDITNLDPVEYPVLLPTANETFPNDFHDALVSYVQQGGTIIFADGAPLYYTKQPGEKQTFANYYNTLRRLHMKLELWWNSDFAQSQLPRHVSEVSRTKEFPNVRYNLTIPSDSVMRYISTTFLQSGDSLISICNAGDKLHQASVCGLIRLNSNMKGNIIFDTRANINCNNVTETLQAKRLGRTLLMSLSLGVSKVFTYHLRAFEDNPDYNEHHFGILHKDFSPKPAYIAYQTLHRFLPDGSTRPTLWHDEQSNAYRAEWATPDGHEITAYWTELGQESTSIPHGAKVYDYLGNDITPNDLNITYENALTYVVN
ncbi:MAG: hypothetical protein J6Y72_09140 [Bacteroidales bacterium]|nr:hypothetical protein [Bacteroidales bacterium]